MQYESVYNTETRWGEEGEEGEVTMFMQAFFQGARRGKSETFMLCFIIWGSGGMPPFI